MLGDGKLYIKEGSMMHVYFGSAFRTGEKGRGKWLISTNLY